MKLWMLMMMMDQLNSSNAVHTLIKQLSTADTRETTALMSYFFQICQKKYVARLNHEGVITPHLNNAHFQGNKSEKLRKKWAT